MVPQPLRTTPAAPRSRLSRAIPFGLQVAGALAAIYVALAAAGWVTLRAVRPLSPVLIGVAVGLLLTALLAPISDRLKRVGLPKYLAALLTLIGFLGFLGGVGWLVGGRLVAGVSDLAESVSAALDAVQEWLRTGPLGVTGDQLGNYLDQARDWATSNSGQLVSGAVQAGQAVSTVLVGTGLALVTALFFLADGRTIFAWVVRLFPRPAQGRIDLAFSQGWNSVRAYVRTQIAVAAMDAVGIAIGAWALGLPLVIPIGVVVFLASFVPVVGAFASGLLVVLIAWASQGFTAALIMLMIVLAVQQIEGNLLQPLLMSKAVDLHPWAVLIGVTIGSYLMGITGAVFAVPLMALVNVVVLSLRRDGDLPDEDDDNDDADNDDADNDGDGDVGGRAGQARDDDDPGRPQGPAGDAAGLDERRSRPPG